MITRTLRGTKDSAAAGEAYRAVSPEECAATPNTVFTNITSPLVTSHALHLALRGGHRIKKDRVRGLLANLKNHHSVSFS